MLDFTASCPPVGKHFGFDVDHDFVPVRGKRRCVSRFELPLGHPRQRIGATHRARRSAHERPTWDVGQEHMGVLALSAGDRFPIPGVDCCIGRGRIPDGRPTWDVLRRRTFGVPPRRRLLRRMRRHRRIERAEDARPHLGREPPVQDHGAVVLVPEGEAAILVLSIGSLGLFRALGPAIEADELLDMLGGSVQSDIEEVDLVLRSGDSGQRPSL